MKIISVVSAKGGVGKTTISANLCSALVSQGHSILALDLDPQNSLRLHFGIAPSHRAGIALESIAKNAWSQAVLKSKKDCSVLPFGNVNERERIEFETLLSSNPLTLTQQLSSLDLPEDAIVVIDTPPGPSAYLKQALSVSNIAIVVALADAASYATIPIITSLIEQYCIPRADFIDYMYVLNQLNRSRELAGDVADIMALQFSNKKIAIVHQDQSIPEALACNQDVMGYAPDSRGTHDLLDFSLLIKPLLDSKLHSLQNENIF